MKFSLVPIFAAIILVVSGVALAALTPDEVVTNIGITVSGDLNNILGTLSTSTGPDDVETIAQNNLLNTIYVPDCFDDFTTIVSDLAADVTAMDATPPFDDEDAEPIVEALDDHSIFSPFGLTAPITAIPRELEAGIDSFVFAMIDLIPTKSSDVTDDKNQLDTSVGNTFSLYQELCIPSPLYPDLLPICISLQVHIPHPPRSLWCEFKFKLKCQ
ncbi:hypothetical protein GGX14DRAFT_403372 [Mycena pura]|uniref:Uncharacterized protein n=1 Tax=Mycena pura TaxID=153505 RepID=A0AAD6V0G4_9AGAR|nr:hypothetical protein GGX14DRAFT_403372 [Mycena pura]